MTPERRRLATALAAVMALNLPLGTVYAFSVFLRPLEATLGVARAELSFVFGLAIIGFTAGMNLGPLLYRRGPAWLLVALAGLASAGGIALAASAQGIVQLALGYGGLFGLGGGVAYILLLQGINLMLPGARGLANGFIISLYPLGAMLGAPLFGWGLAAWGLRPTLWALALVLAVATLASALLARCSGLVVVAPVQAAPAAPAGRSAMFAWLWSAYFLAAAAGLMVLGQGAAMVEAFGGARSLALAATTGITACVAAARIGGGWLADRFSARVVILGAHLLALGGNLLLLVLPGPWTAALVLGVIATCYGIVSGSGTAAIAEYWPAAMFGRMAGRLYIAWCVAAVTLPVVAGRIFDLTGSYLGAIAIGALGNALGMWAGWRLPRRG